jgi:hypothetical protein
MVARPGGGPPARLAAVPENPTDLHTVHRCLISQLNASQLRDPLPDLPRPVRAGIAGHPPAGSAGPRTV